MSKDVKRIVFYTKKIAQLGSIHPTVRDAKWRRRAVSLAAYKKAMHESFQEQSTHIVQ